jgi:hypothetical protein
MMAGSQEWLSKTMVGSRAQPTGRMVASSQDCPGSIYRQDQQYKPRDLKFQNVYLLGPWLFSHFMQSED